MNESHIAIVGAGIGGLSAALGLARAGHQVQVFEQTPALGDVGAGISLSPNAMKGLRYLGLEPAIEAAADEPPQQITRRHFDGEVLVHIDRSATREQYGAPYLQMHRADLHSTLVAALAENAPGAVTLGKAAVNAVEQSDGVEIEFADGTSTKADVLIAADGLKSAIRQRVFGEDAPDFSGFVAWRGLIPRGDIEHLKLAPGSCVWVGPARVFVRYPVRHGALENIVAFAKTDQWETESWSQTASTDDLRTLFAEFQSDVLALIDALPGGRCHTWGLFARDPIPHWATERIAVLGDAAHPMLPWFGQGAASAIEDGVVLARAFVEAAAPAEALQRYQAARRDRVTEIHRESLLGGERLVDPNSDKLKNHPPRTEDSLGITRYDPATAAV